MSSTLKFGRRAPKNAPALRLAPLLTGTLPPVPVAADYLARLNGGWQMLGNDTYGDCVAVAVANLRRLITAALGTSEFYADLAAVEAFYKTQNPGFPAEDNGMDIQTALETLVSEGGRFYDGVAPLAFAKVDHTNLAEVRAAIAIFGGVLTGEMVQSAQMQEFDQGKPWDFVDGSPDDGGHCTLGGGYGAGTGQLSGDVRFITWAQETSFTDAYWTHKVEECWVVIYPEHTGTKAFLEGVDQAALAQAYQTLTGRPFPVGPTPTPQPPQPTPPPAPTPVPPTPPAPPVDADAALNAALNTWAVGRIRRDRVAAGDYRLMQALVAWQQAHGFTPVISFG